MRLAIALAALAGAACQQTAAPARNDHPTACHNVLDRTLVADKETATAIAKAVIAEYQRSFPMRPGDYELVVEEEVDHWVAFQALAPLKQTDGSVQTTFGGGGLGMHIAKCDGALSSVALQR